MLNVNALNKTLSAMSLPQLQSYASMHKNDPYVVAMALSIANTKKEALTAQQGMAGQQPMPKVVDQDIAQIAPQQHVLPEESGIGQLPAPNIQGMAGGGIVAFDEGGEVPHFDGTAGSRVYDPMNPENPFAISTAYRKWKESGLPLLPYLGINTTVPAPATANTPVKPAVDQTAAENARLAAQNQNAAGVPSGGIDTLLQDKAAADKIAADKAAAAQLPPSGGVGAGFEKKFLDMIGKGEVSKEDRMKEMTDINKPVLEKMTSLIEDNKNKLKSEGEQNFYMSLIQGGLAAAGASGPNALQNLAQGFEKGAGHYSEGLKDLRKAAQENRKMELSMAEYEASGKKDALKSYYDHQDKMQSLKAQGLASIMGHEISKEGQIAAAGAGANAQRSLMEALGNAPEDSALRKGFEMTKQEARIPAMYQAYVTAATDPMKGEDFLKKYPTFDVYRAGMGGAGSGQFITLPNGAVPSTAVRARQN